MQFGSPLITGVEIFTVALLSHGVEKSTIPTTISSTQLISVSGGHELIIIPGLLPIVTC